MPGLSLGLSLGRHTKKIGGFSAQASNYFSRLAAAGDTTYPPYKQPIANYIDALVANGQWDKLESSALFVGVGIEGIVVPLKSGMPAITNNGPFVSGDLSQTAGLIGDAAAKYIDTGLTDAGTQDDAAATVYITTGLTGTFDAYIGSSESGTGTFKIFSGGAVTTTGFQGYATATDTETTGAAPTGLLGMSRSASANYDVRIGDSTINKARSSETPQGNNLFVFATNNGGTPLRHCDARLATYTAGTALNMATLEGLQDTLITEIAAI